MKKDNIAKEKALQFAIRIVRLHNNLRKEKREYSLSDQILRSGTSIGANISEAEYAVSEREMLSKLKIALKEAAETRYWIELLFKTDYIDEKEYNSLNGECSEIIRILAASTKTLSNRQKSDCPIEI